MSKKFIIYPVIFLLIQFAPTIPLIKWVASLIVIILFIIAWNKKKKPKKQETEDVDDYYLPELNGLPQKSKMIIRVFVIALIITTILTIYETIRHPGNADISIHLAAYFLILVIGIPSTVNMLKDQRQRKINRNNIKLIRWQHGKARWARLEEFTNKGYDLDQISERLQKGQPTGIFHCGIGFYDQQGHILTVGGARSGKGTNLIIPNLLYPVNHSIFVIDPKGENTAVTLRFNKEKNRKTFVINPWEILDLENHSYNPLQILFKYDGKYLVDDCEMLAECIIPIKDSSDSTRYFEDKARSFLATIMMHISSTYDKEDIHLITVRKLVKLSSSEFENLVAEMMSNDTHDGIIAENANEIANILASSPEQFQSIMSTVSNAVELYKSPQIRHSVKTSDFDISDIVNGDMVIYVVIPPDRMSTFSNWLRLLVMSTLTAIQRNPKERVLMLLDEFFSLGYLREIEKGISLMPGYNLVLWMILQDLNQLKTLYPNSWESFIANSAVKHFIKNQDIFTAEYLSKLLGKTTRYTYETKTLRLKDHYGEDLMSVQEIVQDKSDMIITFIRDCPPIMAPKMPYYNGKYIPENWYDDNPYHKY